MDVRTRFRPIIQGQKITQDPWKNTSAGILKKFLSFCPSLPDKLIMLVIVIFDQD